MKKFKFRLERVLTHRTAVKDEKRRDLLARNQWLYSCESRLEDLESSERDNRLPEDGVISIELLKLTGSYAMWLDEAIERQRGVIKEAEEAVEEAMAAYIQAAQDEEALLTLKKRQKAAYDEYVEKEEEKVLDELTTQRGNTLYTDDLE